MPIDPRLTATLVCPVCKGSLVWDEEKSVLVCPRCRLAFSVKDNMPDMIADNAKAISVKEADAYREKLSVVRGA